MSRLSQEALTTLRKQGRSLNHCATIGEAGLHPMVIENICCFIAKTPLIKVELTESKTADRQKQAEALASSTDSEIIQLTGKSLLLYRVPIFAI